MRFSFFRLPLTPANDMAKNETTNPKKERTEEEGGWQREREERDMEL